MRLVRDEHACLAALDDFVAGRVGAAVFIAHFRQLWQRDRVDGVDGVQAMREGADNAAVLHGLLDSVGSLCATYAQSLAPGGGYRVSEEQFRKEIRSMTAELALPGGREA